MRRRHGLVGNRTVGNREVRLLDEAVSIDLEPMSSFHVAGPPLNGVSISGCRMCQISLQHLLDRLAQRPRMLVAQDRPVRVVVDGDVLRSPPQQQGKAICEQEPHHHPEGGRPRFDRADRRRGPVERANQVAHLAAALEPGGGSGIAPGAFREDDPSTSKMPVPAREWRAARRSYPAGSQPRADVVPSWT